MLLPTAPIGPQITPDEYFYLVTYLFIPHPVPTNPKFLQFMFYEIKESVLSGEWDLSPKEVQTSNQPPNLVHSPRGRDLCSPPQRVFAFLDLILVFLGCYTCCFSAASSNWKLEPKENPSKTRVCLIPPLFCLL